MCFTSWRGPTSAPYTLPFASTATPSAALVRFISRVGNPVEHLAVLHGADTNAPQPTRVRRHAVGFRVGNVDESVADIDAARPAELLPLGDEAVVLVEDLNAHVAAVGDKEASFAIHLEVVRQPEFARAGAELAERLDISAVLGELREILETVSGFASGAWPP